RKPAHSDSDAFDWNERLVRSVAWVVPACLLAVAALLFYNRMLARENEARKIAEEEWIAAFQSNDAHLRVSAARVLGKMSAASSEALDLLVEGLESESLDVRRAAVQALGDAGPAAAHLTAKIKRLQQADPEPPVRDAAAEAFRKLSGVRGPSNF